MENVTVYGLIDPHTEGVRYIGITTNLARRFSQHLATARAGEASGRADWIRGLLNEGTPPLVVTLEVVPLEHCAEAERRHIHDARMQGHHLLNKNDGGDCAALLPTTRQRMGDARRGRPLRAATVKKLRALRTDPEFRANLSAKIKGRKFHTDEAKKRISAASRGRPMPAHAREAIRRARTGKRPTEGARARMSAAHKGHPATIGTTGMRMSAETRERMSVSQKARWEAEKASGTYILPTHCKRGHAFSPNNVRTYTTGKGTTRHCKECARIRGKEARAKHE